MAAARELSGGSLNLARRSTGRTRDGAGQPKRAHRRPRLSCTRSIRATRWEVCPRYRRAQGLACRSTLRAASVRWRHRLPGRRAMNQSMPIPATGGVPR